MSVVVGQKIKINDTITEVEYKWSDEIYAQTKEELDYLKTEKAVREKAEALIKEKLGNINDALYDIEQQLWKLED